MFIEVENVEELESGDAEIEVECDQEFIDVSKERTGIEEGEEAVKEMVLEILKERVDYED